MLSLNLFNFSLKLYDSLMISYSVVILHHNKADYSRACLASLLGSSARPLQIINVNNGSNDETSALLEEWETAARAVGIEVQTLHFSSNIGAIQGRNAALEVATGSHLAFLDNDTIIAQTNWLQELASALDARAEIGIVAPKLLFPWAPFLIECCGCAVSPSGRIEYLARGAARDSVEAARPVQCAISAAWLMKRELVEQIGVLDDAFSPVQYEDLDFCYRARAANWQVWTAPHVEVYHFEHTTTAGSDDINFGYVTAKNGVLFKKRWGATFAEEAGTSETQAAWKTLPKYGIHEVNWRALLPKSAAR